MTTDAVVIENETKSEHSSSSSACWQARDAWWKCLDLYDNCEWKCQKQIKQLHHACSAQMVGQSLNRTFLRWISLSLFLFRFDSSMKDVRN